jgi:hypothetical protein
MVAQVVFYLAMFMPLIWWPVFAIGIYVYWRTHSFPLLLVVLGSFLLGLIGLQSLLFRPDSTMDAFGNAKIYTVGLLPIEVQLIATSIGILLIVVGLVVLVLRLLPHRVDT